MKVLLTLGYLLWEGVRREVEWNKTQQPTKTYTVCWLDPIVECKTLVFFLNSEHNIYAFTYIHIIFLKARSWPPCATVPLCTLCHLTGFHFSFILPGEIISSHAAATQNKVFPTWNSTWICWRGEVLLREHQKSTWMNRKPCLCAIGAEAGVVGPSRVARTNCSQKAEGRAMQSPGPRQPQDPPPSKPKFGDAVGIFFKKYLLTVLFDFL